MVDMLQWQELDAVDSLMNDSATVERLLEFVRSTYSSDMPGALLLCDSNC